MLDNIGAGMAWLQNAKVVELFPKCKVLSYLPKWNRGGMSNIENVKNWFLNFTYSYKTYDNDFFHVTSN